MYKDDDLLILEKTRTNRARFLSIYTTIAIDLPSLSYYQIHRINFLNSAIVAEVTKIALYAQIFRQRYHL